MECPHAYMKQNIEYVLCNKEPEPNRHDREKLFHSMCGHQVNCPRENCHKLSAGWRNCMKLVVREQAEEPQTYEEVFPDAGEDPELVQPKPRRTRKSKKPAEDE